MINRDLVQLLRIIISFETLSYKEIILYLVLGS